MRGAAVRAVKVVVPMPLKWHRKLVAWLIAWLIRLVAATLRYECRDPYGTISEERKHPVIFSIWHNRLGLCMIIFRDLVGPHSPSRRLAAIVSASGDGGLVARILEHFSVQPVRGSSSRRGPQALLELTSWAERGYDLAITPDGPRGPCYVVQDGVTSLSQLTGLPIVPVGYHLQWKLRLKSWDRFQIPLPFSRWTVIFGKPFVVPRDASDEIRQAIPAELEKELRAITLD
jgi:lysophospholipid acyltransferase (LPLAT)-like uncharacterized protein